MPLPGNISTRVVTGKYLDPKGNPIAGQVIFSVLQVLIDAAGTTILIPSQAAATLDATGAFSVTLPVTDDVDVNPLNYLYTVTESFFGGRTFQISLPTAGGAIDISTLAPVPTFALVYLLASALLWTALVGRVAAEEALFNTSTPTYRGVNLATFTADVALIAASPSPMLLVGVS